MLHLARRIRLGPHVADLLQLQRALQRGRVADAAAEEVEVAGVLELMGQRRDVLGVAERVLDLVGQRLEDLHERADLAGVQRAPQLRKVERKHLHGHDLGEMGLRGRHADLGPGMRVEHRVGLTGHRRVDHVRDGEDLRLVRRAAGEADRLHRVERLAGLADADHERARAEHGVAIAELAGDIDLARHAGPMLQRILRHEAGVEARAAADDGNPVDLLQVLVGEAHLVELEATAG